MAATMTATVEARRSSAQRERRKRHGAAVLLEPSSMTSQERFSNVHAQLEHLQAKYVGTGHSDITKLCAAARTHTL